MTRIVEPYIAAAIEAATQDVRAEVSRLKEQAAELQDVSVDRAED